MTINTQKYVKMDVFSGACKLDHGLGCDN